jgi:VWFA-related protein
MKLKKISYRWRIIVSAIAISFSLLTVITPSAQQNVSADGREVTILVTVDPHNARTRALADKLQADDFAVREDKVQQKILAAKRAGDAPPVIAVLVQDDLVSRVSNEIKGLKEFIRRLPEGSQVMTSYITAGSLSIAQDFTTDREKAARSLRIVKGSDAGSPYNPYVEVIEALRRFDSQPAGRRIMLLVSDGLDSSQGLRNASPMQSNDLDRAIREAQRRGVTIFSFYAPAVGLTSVNRLATNYGQGSLKRLADETGGEAFYSGFDFVSFAPYFKELNASLGRQWLITYRSTNSGSDFRKIEVSTEFDIHLHHATGYDPPGMK